jgi:dienelactone hydrolase
MLDSRTEITNIIGIKADDLLAKVDYRVIQSTEKNGYERKLIEFDSYEGAVIAYLLVPNAVSKNPAILINHQHNGERHLGKSEVCGLAGNPLQAFGPVLARNGFVVLAPDSICFEERRKGAQGIIPLSGDGDFLQHYNEMCYRIVKGETLMKKVLLDSMNGITLLSGLSFVDSKNIGTLGHSYGGNTVLFLSALDGRINFSCASGSACTYQNRMTNYVGIEMASVIPGFNQKYDIQDLVRCIAPRRLLVVSAEDDKYSKDADFTIEQALPSYEEHNNEINLCHMRYPGGHALTEERFDFIVKWISDCGNF